MGRITISLPDALEAQLDRYAQEHSQPVSHFVAEALAAFLGGASRPSPGDGARLQQVEAYVARMALQLEGLRRFVDEVAFWENDKPPEGYQQPLPPPLQPPSWQA